MGGKKNRKPYFYRYTNLAAAIHLLKNRQITLLDPMKWDDSNDVFFMKEYKKHIKAKRLRAVCFVQGGETYHHWKLFSDGPHGVSIDFEKDELLSAFGEDNKIRHGSMEYKRIEEMEKLLKELPLNVPKLPFLKRYPYRGEKEYRVIYVDTKKRPRHKNYGIGICLSWIKLIRLSPWMPEPLEESVIETLKSIRGCSELKIVRSTVIDSRRWKSIGEEAG